MRAPWILISSISFGVACGGPSGLEDARHPTGSQTIAATAQFDGLIVAHAHENTLSRIRPNLRKEWSIDLPGEPTRVVEARGHIFVTLRALREVAVFTERGDEVARIAVGPEPFGIVANEDESRVYVAASLSSQVVEIDAERFEILRRFSVSGEPRWLALHPEGVLYAMSAYGGAISEIDLDVGEIRTTRLPARTKFSVELGRDITFDRRTTGDPSVTPDGRHVLVPAMYFDTESPIHDPASSPALDALAPPTENLPIGYTRDRFNPAVVIYTLTADARLKDGDAFVVPIAAFLDGKPVIGYPSSVTPTADSLTALVSIEGGAGLVAVQIEPQQKHLFGRFDSVIGGIAPESFDLRPIVTFSADAGPRGIALLDDSRAFVYAFLDRTVQGVRLDAVRDYFVPGRSRLSVHDRRFLASERVLSTDATLPDAIEAGRRLFYATNDFRVSQGGLSCATCHFDGRADGATWRFDRGPRQTPSLAGQVSLTAPVRWEGDRATVEEDARMTSQGLMGGVDLSDENLGELGAFIDWTRDVDSPLRGSGEAAIARGKAIFERPDVACASCHAGPRLTNNTSYPMFGMEAVQTRSLIGISGSPPYFHDGSARTLRDVLERARDGSMGNTSALSDAEMNDLETYLRSL